MSGPDFREQSLSIAQYAQQIGERLDKVPRPYDGLLRGEGFDIKWTDQAIRMLYYLTLEEAAGLVPIDVMPHGIFLRAVLHERFLLYKNQNSLRLSCSLSQWLESSQSTSFALGNFEYRLEAQSAKLIRAGKEQTVIPHNDQQNIRVGFQAADKI